MALATYFTVGVECEGGADERLEFAYARGVDPLVDRAHRLAVAAGQVHRPELVDQQQPAVQVLVGVGELVEDRPVLGSEVVASAADRETRAFDPRRPLGIGVAEGLPQAASEFPERLAGQLDDVEWVGADPGVGAPRAGRADPTAVQIDRHHPDQPAALRP